MAGKHSTRDGVTGRWARVPTENTALAADSRFETMKALGIKTQPDSYAYGMTVRDKNNAAPEYDAPGVKDDLAVGGSPLRPRTQTLIDASRDGTTEWHALPKPATIAPETMTSAGRAPADEETYLTGDLGGSGPSYNPGSARLRARNPELVHPDDNGHHNAVLRSAARGSGPDDPSFYLVGGCDD